MRRRRSFTIFALLSMLILVTGCDLNWLGDLTQPGTGGTHPPETGTIEDTQTFTLTDSGDYLTVRDLAADEKLVIGVAPVKESTIGVSYKVRVVVEGMTSTLGQSSELQVAAQGQSNLPGESQGAQNVGMMGELMTTPSSSVADYRTVPGAFSTVIPEQRETGLTPQSESPYQRFFWVMNAKEEMIQVAATKKGTAGNVNIYLDDHVGDVSDYQISRLISEVQYRIYPQVTQIFGQPDYMDGLHDIDILVTDLDDDQSEITLAGYFDERNYFYNSDENIDYSNECEMIYLNSNLLAEGELNRVYGTVAHELQHLLFYSNKVRAWRWNSHGARFNPLYSDMWINEGFAVLASHLMNYLSLEEDARIYSQNYGYFNHTAKDGLLTWKNQIYEYGSVGLFAYYLYDHFGEEILMEIAESPNKAIDAMLGYIREDFRYSSMDFPTLLGHWNIANRVDRLAGNWHELNHYPDLVLKTQPTGKQASLINEETIWGNGVQYLEVQGPTDELRVTVEQVRGLSYPDQVQVSIMIIAP